MCGDFLRARIRAGRSPCGERGLKLVRSTVAWRWNGRSPCGERGLKSSLQNRVLYAYIVAPRAGSVD